MKNLLDYKSYAGTSYGKKSELLWHINNNYLTQSLKDISNLETDSHTELLLIGQEKQSDAIIADSAKDYWDNFFNLGLQLELSQEITNIIAKAISSHSGLEELCKMFIEHIRTIPEVQRVLLYRETESIHLLTIIDAIPFERSIRNHIWRSCKKVKSDHLAPSPEAKLGGKLG